MTFKEPEDFVPVEGLDGLWSYTIIRTGSPVTGNYYILTKTRLIKKATHDMRGNYVLVKLFRVKK